MVLTVESVLRLEYFKMSVMTSSKSQKQSFPSPQAKAKCQLFRNIIQSTSNHYPPLNSELCTLFMHAPQKIVTISILANFANTKLFPNKIYMWKRTKINKCRDAADAFYCIL